MRTTAAKTSVVEAYGIEGGSRSRLGLLGMP
eukprot:COSAG04_NODE_16492_length_497_cov_1.298995_1_plen_30_part_01